MLPALTFVVDILPEWALLLSLLGSESSSLLVDLLSLSSSSFGEEGMAIYRFLGFNLVMLGLIVFSKVSEDNLDLIYCLVYDCYCKCR